jgi:hypothetical protein
VIHIRSADWWSIPLWSSSGQLSGTPTCTSPRYSSHFPLMSSVSDEQHSGLRRHSLAGFVPNCPVHPPLPDQVFNDQATELDFRCSFWMLQTSLDKTIKVHSRFPRNNPPTSGLNPQSTPQSSWSVSTHSAAALSPSGYREQWSFAVQSSLQEYRPCVSSAPFLHLLSTEPTSAIIGDVRQRYGGHFHSHVDLRAFHVPSSWWQRSSMLFAEPGIEVTEVDWRDYTHQSMSWSHFRALLPRQPSSLPQERSGETWLIPSHSVFCLKIHSLQPRLSRLPDNHCYRLGL